MAAASAAVEALAVENIAEALDSVVRDFITEDGLVRAFTAEAVLADCLE